MGITPHFLAAHVSNVTKHFIKCAVLLDDQHHMVNRQNGCGDGRDGDILAPIRNRFNGCEPIIPNYPVSQNRKVGVGRQRNNGDGALGDVADVITLFSHPEIPAAIGSCAEPLGVGNIECATITTDGHSRGKPTRGDVTQYKITLSIQHGDGIYSRASNV